MSLHRVSIKNVLFLFPLNKAIAARESQKLSRQFKSVQTKQLNSSRVQLYSQRVKLYSQTVQLYSEEYNCTAKEYNCTVQDYNCTVKQYNCTVQEYNCTGKEYKCTVKDMAKYLQNIEKNTLSNKYSYIFSKAKFGNTGTGLCCRFDRQKR